MAIDTRDERASAVTAALPFFAFGPLPDGSISSPADRQFRGWSYVGILAQSNPTFVNALIYPELDEIHLGFSEPVEIGAGGNGGFALTASGGAVTMTYVSGDGTRRLIYSLSRTVGRDETITLAYTQPGDGVEDADGNDVASFTDAPISFAGGTFGPAGMVLVFGGMGVRG